jgi:hypothetical protein
MWDGNPLASGKRVKPGNPAPCFDSIETERALDHDPIGSDHDLFSSFEHYLWGKRFAFDPGKNRFPFFRIML